MLPDSPPQNLARFQELAERHGQIVRRDYNWGGEYTDEDGVLQYAEARWETALVKEEKQDDGKVIVHMIFLEDRTIETGWDAQWEHLIKLNDMGFQHYLEKEGYA